MHFPLSHTAGSGGVQSLFSLLRKLARAGEASALIAILNAFALPLESRVRWTALGNDLMVEAA